MRKTGRTGAARRPQRRVSCGQRRGVLRVQRDGRKARGGQQRRSRGQSPFGRTSVRFGVTPRVLSFALYQLFCQVGYKFNYKLKKNKSINDSVCRLVAPLPCPSCDRVAFCGEPCRKSALKSYHAVECPLLPTLFAAGVSITCLLALRIVTQRPLKYFLDLRSKLSSNRVPTYLD